MNSQCNICGARLTEDRKTTCSPVCARAQANGRSRYAQLTIEAQGMPYPEKRNDSRDMDEPFHNIGGQ